MLLCHALLGMPDESLDDRLCYIGSHEIVDHRMPQAVEHEVRAFEVQLWQELFVEPAAKVATPSVLRTVGEAGKQPLFLEPSTNSSTPSLMRAEWMGTMRREAAAFRRLPSSSSFRSKHQMPSFCLTSVTWSCAISLRRAPL